MRNAVLAIVASGLLAVATKPARSAVRNAGFEECEADTATLVTWGMPKMAGAEFARDDSVAHSGDASGRITGTDAAAQSRFVQAWRQDVPIEPGKRYRLSVWVKASELTNGRLTVLHKDPEGAVLQNQSVTGFSGTFGWRNLGGPLVQVDGAVGVQLVLGLQKSTGTVWIDDVELVEMGDPVEELGSWEFRASRPLVAGTSVPVECRFVLGTRGLSPGGALTLQWHNWRPAREFKFEDVRAESSVPGAAFEITIPPRKKSWPPDPRPVACVATLSSAEALAPGSAVFLRAELAPSPHSNVISPLGANIRPGKGHAPAPFAGTVDLRSEGGNAASIRCVAEMRPLKGKPGRVTVAVTDRHGNPATGFRGTVSLTCEGSDLPAEHVFTKDDAGSHTFPATVAADGISRVHAASGELVATSNPIVPRDVAEPAVYFGDIHSHCEVSGDGVGDPDLAYEYARRFHGLDFACLSDHSPREERWERILAVNQRHNAPGAFVALTGYEWSSKPFGHRNAYFPTATAPPQPSGLKNNTTDWWTWLDTQDLQILTVPHHTNTQAAQIMANGKPAWEPCDWSVINHKYQRVVEICQNRGSFEAPGGPIEELRIRRKDVGASVQTALAMGHRLGFIGSTDTHSGRPGTGDARCAILATDLTRRHLWQALYDRHCYGTTGAHIFLEFFLNDTPMGTELTLDGVKSPREIRWRVAGTAPIKRIDLLRNNVVVKSWDGEGAVDMGEAFTWDKPFAGTEWWYLRVIQTDTQLAWSSPIWVD